MRRFVIAGLLAGGLLGAMTPIELVFGTSCADLTLTHSSQITSCGTDYEDHAVDYIHNGGTSSALICIVVEATTNVSAVSYAPTQCQSHQADQELQYSVSTDRTVRCSCDTAFDTDSYLGDDCDDPHEHLFEEECCP